MDNIVNAVLEALNRIKAFKKDIIAIDYLYNEFPTIHIDGDAFFNHFDNYKASNRDCTTYPIKLSETYNGIEFYSVYKVEDFHATK